MALYSEKDVALGSGSVYVMPWTGTIPEDYIIETNTYRLGLVKDGAVLKYKPTYKDIYNPEGDLVKTVLIKEDITLKFGLITVNNPLIEKLIPSAVEKYRNDVDDENPVELWIGGECQAPLYVVRFVSTDEHRITIVGANHSTIDLTFQKKKETVINAEFVATPMDNAGTLLRYFDSAAPTPPSSEAQPEDVRYGKIAGDIVGTMPNVSSVTATVTSSAVTVKPSVAGYLSTSGVTATGDFGTAGYDDILSGKTATSSTGKLITGGMTDRTTAGSTLDIYHRSYRDTETHYAFYDTHTGSYSRTAVNGNTDLLTPKSSFGDATAEDVAAGKTFTSAEGFNIVGTAQGGGSLKPAMQIQTKSTLASGPDYEATIPRLSENSLELAPGKYILFCYWNNGITRLENQCQVNTTGHEFTIPSGTATYEIIEEYRSDHFTVNASKPGQATYCRVYLLTCTSSTVITSKLTAGTHYFYSRSNRDCYMNTLFTIKVKPETTASDIVKNIKNYSTTSSQKIQVYDTNFALPVGDYYEVDLLSLICPSDNMQYSGYTQLDISSDRELIYSASADKALWKTHAVNLMIPGNCNVGWNDSGVIMRAKEGAIYNATNTTSSCAYQNVFVNKLTNTSGYCSLDLYAICAPSGTSINWNGYAAQILIPADLVITE